MKRERSPFEAFNQDTSRDPLARGGFGFLDPFGMGADGMTMSNFLGMMLPPIDQFDLQAMSPLFALFGGAGGKNDAEVPSTEELRAQMFGPELAEEATYELRQQIILRERAADLVSPHNEPRDPSDEFQRQADAQREATHTVELKNETALCSAHNFRLVLEIEAMGRKPRHHFDGLAPRRPGNPFQSFAIGGPQMLQGFLRLLRQGIAPAPVAR